MSVDSVPRSARSGGSAASFLLPGLLLAVAGGAVVWILREPEAPPAKPEARPAPEPARSVPAAPEPAALAKEPKKTSEPRMLKLPDGTAVKPLNGVVEPAAIVWGEHPWSPIVRTEHNNGIDWYVHADGTYTTTMMQWRSDLKREDPVTLCLHPAAPAPVAPSATQGR